MRYVLCVTNPYIEQMASETNNAVAQPDYSIAVMCYNEEGNLREMVERTLATMRKTGVTFDILIINDGSKDKSGEIADALAKENREVRVLHHSPNKGIGSVLIAGYGQTRGKVAAILPADLQFAPEDMPAAMKALDGADVVNITRPQRNDPFKRKVISFIDRSLVRVFFGLRAADLHWVKLYRRGVLDKITIVSRTPLVDTELLIKANRMKAKIVELPLQHYPRVAGQSTGGNLKLLIKTFLELWKLRLKI